MWNSFLVVLLVSVLVVQNVIVVVNGQAAEQCPLCLGGAEANLTNTVAGGVSCSALVSDVELDLESCRELQLVGFRYCGCPEYPDDFFCPMCQDAFVDIPNPFQSIPGLEEGEEKTCDDYLFVKASTVTTCDDAMKPGYVCGCPDAPVPYCQICGGSLEDDANLSQPDATLTINGVGSFTCRQLATKALLGSLSVDQCSLVQGEAAKACGCPGGGTLSTTDNDNSDGSSETSTPSVPTATDATATPDNNSAAHAVSPLAPMAMLVAFPMLVLSLEW